MRLPGGLCLALLLLAVCGGPLGAQEDGARDPLSLARRLGGLQGAPPLAALTPRYAVGEQERFFISRADADAPQRITATLVVATPGISLWVEEGLAYDAGGLAELATGLERIFLTQRLRGVHGELTQLPGVGPIMEPNSLLPLPDVDGEAQLYLLYARDTGGRAARARQADLLPAALAPGGFSNQHELLLLDATALGGEPLHSPAWLTLIAEAHFELLSQTHAPQQSLWLRRALAGYITRLMELQPVMDRAPAYFLDTSGVPLTRPANVAAPGVGSGQQLFLDYLLARHGMELFRQLWLQPEAGLGALDAALAATGQVDALTGRPADGLGIFADFVIAGAGQLLPPGPFVDGRYSLLAAALPEEERLPAGIALENQLDVGLPNVPLEQFGTRYIYVVNEQPARFRLHFRGNVESALLPLPESDEPGNRFYWSGAGGGRDHTLTRRVDLREVERATLQFDSWHLLEEQRSYVYVMVSDDEGAGWQMLEGRHARGGNRYGLAYGPGLTGVSNNAPPQPYPFIGVLLGGEGQTITEVTPGGPASGSALRAGDVLIGQGGATWAEGDGIFPLLERHAPGDEVEFTIQRGTERLVIPVTLGAHPQRLRPRPPLWLRQEIDLSEHAGREILLRFEYVSPPDADDQGLALDNIRIPETGFHDDGRDGAGWQMRGWQRRDNFVPQRYLLQSLSGGHSGGPPRVRRLIGPGDTTRSGSWDFDIAPDEVIVFAVSAISEETRQAAWFDLALETLDAGL